jgi:hypothetical protein
MTDRSVCKKMPAKFGAPEGKGQSGDGHAMGPGERRRCSSGSAQAAAPPVGHRRLRLASLPAVAASQRRSRLSFHRMPSAKKNLSSR